MLRRFSINFALFSMVLDGLAVWLSLSLAARLRPVLNALAVIEPIDAPVQLPAAVTIALPIVWVIVFSLLSIYDGRRYLRVVDEFAALTLAIVIASICSAGILYLTYRDVSRALFGLFVLLAGLTSNGWRVIARLRWRGGRTASSAIRRVLIVGLGPLGQRVREKLEKAGAADLVVAGMVDDRRGGAGVDAGAGGRPSLSVTIGSLQVTDVILALPHSAYGQLGDVVGEITNVPVRVWVALGFFDLALYRTAIEEVEGIPMLDLRASAIDDYQRLLKRAFDVIVACLALLMSLPFMALSALLILADDGAPVLFRQPRVGENGRTFTMLKFRTMQRDAERLQAAVERSDATGNLVHKHQDDPRVTRVGRFLRRLSLDELPQLFNVLRGEMSMVGPRPELAYLVEQYQPWQRKRFAVPPGLTGWWQVRGRSDKPMHLHTEDDLYYIQNYTIWFDIEILLRTVWVVLLGKGAY